jgi:prephenate dehydratase
MAGPNVRVGYLGPAGSFTEAAAVRVCALDDLGDAELVPLPTVPLALDAVRDGELELAVVPLESSVEGSVPLTMDELAFGEPLHIVREVVLPIRFALLAPPGASAAGLRTVGAHPHGLAQCRGFVRDQLPGVEVVAATSNSDAARRVAAGDLDAAFASPATAATYGLAVLVDDVGDNKDAATRFVAMRRPGPTPAPTGNDATSLVAFEKEDRPGALLEILTEFAVRGVNLTRLESRPTGAGLGRYCFFLDCAGHVAELRVGEALMGLYRLCADVRFLGSYPRAAGGPLVPRSGTTDADFLDASGWLARLRAE